MSNSSINKCIIFNKVYNYINHLMTEIGEQSSQKTQKNRLRHEDSQPISKRTKTIIFFGCNLALCLVIIINAVYETPLFILGVNFIYEYQTTQNYNMLHVVQNLFSMFCNPIGIGIVLVLYYIIINRKLLLMVHLSYFLLTAYLMGLLKQSFQQSRPIWVNDKIQKWEWSCPKDFGNPSGHSFAVTLLYEPIISDSIGYGKYKIWAFVLLFLCVMVPISRMYLGVHSANQILFGLLLGQIFLVLYKYVYQRYIYFLFWSMLMKHKKYKKLALAIVLHIVAFAVPIIFYNININSRPIPQNDILNLNKKCDIEMTGLLVQGHMLTSCAGFSFFFGIFYGFVLLIDTQGYRKYLLGLWEYESFKHILLKIFVYLVCAVLPSVIFSLVADHAFTYERPISKYIFMSLSSLFFGLGLSYFAPVLTHRLNIMKFLPGPAQNYEQKLEDIN